MGSLRADEIKLWLTPSAKQRRNPCSGLPAEYPDFITHYDWSVKKDLCFDCRDRLRLAERISYRGLHRKRTEGAEKQT